MDSQRLDDVTGWSSRPFADGYDGLRDLADREFSGAVTEGTAWAFFLNGRIVGVFDGTVEDFEGADGTAYEAPHPSLPLLYAMQESGGETRAKYYTNDTPMSEVDRTLSAGNFTGYVELSENVLSGDYYTVYHGGRSMSAAYVGSSRRLITGDEAFERAADEVGIYEVTTVPVEIVEIPGEAEEAERTDAGAVGAAGASDDSGEDAVAADADTAVTDASESDADGDATADRADAGDPTDTDDRADAPGESGAADAATPNSGVTHGASAESDDADRTTGEPAATSPTAAADPVNDSTGEADRKGSATEPTSAGDDASATTAGDSSSTPATDDASSATAGSDGVTFGGDEQLDDAAVDDLADEVTADTSPDEEPLVEEATDGAEGGSAVSAETEWQETTTIPALDPEESLDDAGGNGSRRSNAAAGSAGGRGRRQAGRSDATDSAGSGRASGSTDSGSSGRRSGRGHSGSARNGVSRERAEQLKEKLEATEEARQQVASELESVREERDALEAERDELRAERDDLEARASTLDSRVAELESQVERLESELADLRADQPDPERAISAREALDGTNLFVRYDSKSGGTLEKAHDGQVDREEVNTNLRLEHHTSFETEDAHVDGQPYEAFLHESIEYGFARWVVQDLLYEIRDTGHEAQLQDLYDAIPKIDRAELNGTVSISYTENGEEHREQQRFDVVLRDRMGNPLLVANLNDSRDAATESMMRELIENARRLAETSDSLGASFLVTASFFAPEALETASEATSGGLLSRSKRESFVKLSRKRGFHLCLVETRNGDFHLNVPEL
jgi:chaperonin cofactor prefoldin